MHFSGTLAFIVSLSGLVPDVAAVDRLRTAGALRTQIWTAPAGLPAASVHALLAARSGYLWVATEDGLARFDGMRFTVFDRRTTPEFRDRALQALAETADGTLWIGTKRGLVRLRDGSFRCFGSADGLPGNDVRAVFVAPDASVWIGTEAGLGRLEEGRFSVVGGLPSTSVRALAGGADGSVWIGTETGVARWTAGRVVVYGRTHGAPDADVWAVREDRGGTLWAGTEQGLARRDPGGGWHLLSRRDGLCHDFVQAILEDRSGALWLGTDGGGVCRYANGRFDTLGARRGLADDVVFSLVEDREGNVWVGTARGGLNRLHEGSVSILGPDSGLPAVETLTVREARDGAMWVGTWGGGLVRLQNGRVRAFTQQDGLASDRVSALHEDRDGTLWVGTLGRGLDRFANGRFTHYGRGLSDAVVHVVHRDRAGVLWVGTQRGLNRLRGDAFDALTVRHGLSADNVLALLEDRSGVLWIGTEGGLDRWSDGQLCASVVAERLGPTKVLSLHEDASGALWIGAQSGLLRLAGQHLTRFEAPLDDPVFQILEDEHGSLWLSSRSGLVSVDRRELEDVAAGRRRSITPTLYGRSDGLQGCNGGQQPAGWRSRDGRLWFAAVQGLASVSPAEARPAGPSPPVLIEEAWVDGRPVPRGAELRLPATTRHIEFRYTALSLRASERVRFRYRLDGFDGDWVDAGTRRTAYYTSLPAGSYRFRVLACNNDRSWHEAEEPYPFRIAPPLHRSAWFYLACAVLVGVCVWVFDRLRVSRLRAQLQAVQAERARMGRDLHDTLAECLTGASLQLEAALTRLKDTAARPQLERARALVVRSLTDARRAVWGLRSEALEGANLFEALCRLAADWMNAVPLAIHVACQGEQRPVPEAVQNNVLRIVQEALTNAVKHSQGRTIHVDLVFTRDDLRVSVRDDGRGFGSAGRAAEPLRFGLSGMRQRARELGAEIRFTSRPDRGAAVDLSVPLS